MNFLSDNLTQKDSTFLRSFATLLCEGAENHLIFTKEKSSDLLYAVKKINFGLTTGKNKPKNLKSSVIQLILLLQQCPQSILNAEGDKWVLFCLENLSNPKESLVKCLIFIMTFIIKASHNNKELSKKVSKYSLRMVRRLYRCHISVRELSFKCLYENLRVFPNQSIIEKKKIEQKLIKVLTSPLNWNRDLVYAAASAYAALPLPGGAGSGPEMKGAQLEQLISLSHQAADAVFYDIKENEKFDFSREHKLPIDTIKSVWELKDPIMRILTSSIILGNCFEFIKIFFEKCTSKFILIKPKDLINLCFRVLQVELQTLKGEESMEIKTLSFILPSLQSRALSLLKSLIQNNVCASPMNLVEEQLVFTLKSTRKASSNVKLVKGDGESSQNAAIMLQSFLAVRIQCYEALNNIAKISNGMYGNCMDELVYNLKADTEPVKDTLTLKQAIVGGRLSLMTTKKRSKKKGYTVTSTEGQGAPDNVSASLAIEQKIPLTIAALELIETIFNYAHHSYPLKYVKVLQDHLMALLNTRRFGIYEDAKVREALFSAVIANALHPNPLCPPSYNFICMALQDELLYSRHQVSSICMKGLSVLSFITSNPNTVNWSDIVSLNKESKTVNTSQVVEEPLVNGDAKDEESDASDNEHEIEDDEENEHVDENEDDEENEPPMLNMDDDEDDSEDIDELDDITTEDNNIKINGNEATSSDEDVNKKSEDPNNDDGSDAENLEEDLQEDNEEESFGDFDMIVNRSDDEKEDDSEEEEEVDLNDEENLLDVVVDDDEEEVVVEEEEEKEKEEITNSGVRLKRRIKSTSNKNRKKSKVESDDDDDVSPSVAEMLAAFVNAPPDPDSDDDT